jgi:hypothetical protein
MVVAEFGSITGYFQWGKSGQTRILAIGVVGDKTGAIDQGSTVHIAPDRYQTTRPADNSDRDKSARMLRQLGPYEKTTRTINNYCYLTYFF